MKKVWMAACLLLVLASCRKVKDFQFKNIVSWRISGLSLSSGSISAELLFYNPNRFAVTFKHLEGNVALEGKDFGTCTSDTTLRIGPTQNFILPVIVNLKPTATLSAGFALLSQDSVRVGFKGVTRVGRSGIFINYKFNADTKVATPLR
jgi:LEA14-like dessication related protein